MTPRRVATLHDHGTRRTRERRGLTCAKCGEHVDGGRIRYVETIECWRQVSGRQRGALMIAGEAHSGEGYDEGRDPHFECNAPNAEGFTCGHRWRVPQSLFELIEWA